MNDQIVNRAIDDEIKIAKRTFSRSSIKNDDGFMMTIFPIFMGFLGMFIQVVLASAFSVLEKVIVIFPVLIFVSFLLLKDWSLRLKYLFAVFATVLIGAYLIEMFRCLD